MRRAASSVIFIPMAAVTKSSEHATTLVVSCEWMDNKKRVIERVCYREHYADPVASDTR